MNPVDIKEASKKAVYYIDQYKGDKKWCFAIVLNRAYDNLEDNPNLLNESLLRFENISLMSWFDFQEDEKQMRDSVFQGYENINKAEQKKEIKLKPDIQKAVVKRLEDLRNYFSHRLHTDDCLTFLKEDPIRFILEKAYEKAKLVHLGRETQESKDFSVPLFEDDKITTAGVILFASFFVEMRILIRVLGLKDVRGFTLTEGKFNLTRKAICHYALPDSYSIKTPRDTKLFRDILGYLSRMPSESYDHYFPEAKKKAEEGEKDKEGEGKDKENKEPQWSKRNTDKFMVFAMRYLEDFQPDVFRICFARQDIQQPQREKDQERKPHKQKGKRKLQFPENLQEARDNPAVRYFIRQNNIDIQIQKNNQKIHCRMGLNELKYLILLCLKGQGGEAIEAIYNEAGQVGNKLPHLAKMRKEGFQDYQKWMPGFVLNHHGLMPEGPNRKEPVAARVGYIRQKWERKRDGSKEARLDSKARDILQYINECGQEYALQQDRERKGTLNIDKYRKIHDFLVNKNIEAFRQELDGLKVDEKVREDLKKRQTVNDLHQRVCNLMIRKLEDLQQSGDLEQLKCYIGLAPAWEYRDEDQTGKEQKEQRFENKVKNLKPMLYRGFLRERFFAEYRSKENKRNFADLVEDVRQKKGEGDVPVDLIYYQIEGDTQEIQVANKKLTETLARDRLCLLIGREYLEQLNRTLSQNAIEERHGPKRKYFIKTEWSKEPVQMGDGKERMRDVIICRIRENPEDENPLCSIRFAVKHWTKLYVMDDPFFLSDVHSYFLSKSNEIDYHTLNQKGICQYTNLQADCMVNILKLEKKVFERVTKRDIDKEKDIKKLINEINNKLQHLPAKKEDNRVPFLLVCEAALEKGILKEKSEIDVVSMVRNSAFHYQLYFSKSEKETFDRIMRREGI